MKKLLMFNFVLICFIFSCAPKVTKNQFQEFDLQNHSNSDFTSEISYEEIVAKLNDVNTANKDNFRTKEFIKEYTYNVGDDDSRNDARNNALNQVKILILEEIGVFVESYLQVDSITDDSSRLYVREEIKSLTAGIIKTEILEEKYDGKTLYIKASALVDPDSVSEGISEVLKVKANQEEVSQLKTLLESKENELDMRSNTMIELQKQLSAQELVNIAKEKELESLRSRLKQYQMQEEKLQGELGMINTKVEQAMSRMGAQSEKAILIKEGMTQKEVILAIGQPAGAAATSYSGDDVIECNLSYSTCDRLYYGNIAIDFTKAGIVRRVYEVR